MRYLPLIALIVVADEFIKFFALQRLPEESELADPGFVALGIHKNWGIAFDIPFRMPVIIIVSLIIGAVLAYVAYRNWKKKPTVAIAALMIILGAAGNIYDRLVYGFTVDYLILFARSAINLSDVVIISGVILMLNASRVHNVIDKTADQA